MTKEDEKDLDQVAEAEAVEETKEGEAPQGGSETPHAGTPKKAEAVKKNSGEKEKLKAALAELKSKRQAALDAGDKVQLKRVRDRYKKANRRLRRAVTSKA
jgi:hypothetical protein